MTQHELIKENRTPMPDETVTTITVTAYGATRPISCKIKRDMVCRVFKRNLKWLEVEAP